MSEEIKVPCVFSEDNRIMLNALSKEVKENYTKLEHHIDELSTLVTTQLFHRLPPYVTIVISILTGIIAFMGGAVLKSLIGG